MEDIDYKPLILKGLKDYSADNSEDSLGEILRKLFRLNPELRPGGKEMKGTKIAWIGEISDKDLYIAVQKLKKE